MNSDSRSPLASLLASSTPPCPPPCSPPEELSATPSAPNHVPNPSNSTPRTWKIRKTSLNQLTSSSEIVLPSASPLPPTLPLAPQSSFADSHLYSLYPIHLPLSKLVSLELPTLLWSVSELVPERRRSRRELQRPGCVGNEASPLLYQQTEPRFRSSVVVDRLSRDGWSESVKVLQRRGKAREGGSFRIEQVELRGGKRRKELAHD